MAHNILSEAELRMLLSNDYQHEEIIQPRRLKLTMKYLYQLIGEIQQEKRVLSSRVDELEQQLYELYQIQEEEASTQEMLNIEEAQLKKPVETEPKPLVPELIETTRSERHPKPEKTSFWDFLFRR
ncbi:hypothetical protein EHS13_27095 [Paenibacillus psychroresistens]|uniref:Uncharacterized protein n=1 Tax=Paenibacillus psychroresistens TaxID=1778678 RepID=A0A6B8RQM0_9BACL|nr:hypothetical protein [Paenibacillus psychroresistens]QGQ98289.1 hypothetical protein EHS13_27095 [Paenibacillus psychroresistens]